MTHGIQRHVARACLSIPLLLALEAATTLTLAQPAARPLVFRSVNVVDPIRGSIVPAQDVVVQDRRILHVGPATSTPVPAGAAVVDGTGKFLMPGLWDAHVHTRYDGIDHLRLFLAYGITSVRDLGGGWDHLDRTNLWTREMDAGTRFGPHILAAGAVLDGPGSVWSHSAVVSSPGEARAAVDRLAQHGAGYLKVYAQLSRDAFVAILDEGNRRNLRVGGHVVRALHVTEAVDLGQSAFEHASDLLIAAAGLEEPRVPITPEAFRRLRVAAAEAYSVEGVRRLSELFHERGVRLTPTLSLLANQAALARGDPAPAAARDVRYVPQAYVRQWSAAPRGSAQDAERVYQASVRLVRQMSESGVDILAGTDVVKPFFVPGDTLHQELELLVVAGLSPASALRASTVAPARYFGIADAGTIAPAQRADLVLLRANPLQSIRNTRQIDGVVAHGRWFDRAALDAMLKDVERGAATWVGTPTGQ